MIQKNCDGICVNCKEKTCVCDVHLLKTGGEKVTGKRVGVAFDIGTTTLVAGLIDLETGEQLCFASTLNPQRKYGLDVLSRISYVQRFGDDGTNELRACLLEQMKRMIEVLTSDKPEKISVAGNCIMIHLLLGEDVKGMGIAPYCPQFLSAREEMLKEFDTPIYCLPHVSAYVGGDVVGGVVETGLPDYSLYLDIGTNGEMILRRGDLYYACSCAVGPALEGMNISCGMTAAEGAIDRVYIQDGELACHVIGDKKAKGICGSGVLSAMVTFLEQGWITSEGRIASGDTRIMLAENIFISQQDIRQVQLAKGAILSGVRGLLAQSNSLADEIKHIFIAGQFGKHIEQEIFFKIGILPHEMKGALKYVGNGSLAGARKALLSNRFRDEVSMFCHNVTYIELANQDDYMKNFVSGLNF